MVDPWAEIVLAASIPDVHELTRVFEARGYRVGVAAPKAVRHCDLLLRIFEHAPVGIAILTAEQRVQMANARWHELFGTADAHSVQLLNLSHPDDRESRTERLAAVAQGTLPRYYREGRLLRADGSIFWGDLVVTRLQTQDEATAFLAIATDVTGRKQAESQQHQPAALLRMRERLAQEVQVTMSQAFEMLSTQIQAISRLLETGSVRTAQDALETLVGRIGAAQRELHDLLRGAPSATEEKEPEETPSLRTLLGLTIQRFSQETSIPVELIASPDADSLTLPLASELQLRRITQEALTNACNHAGAQRIQVYLSLDDHILQLSIHDDGWGFVPPVGSMASMSHEGAGIQMMYDRARKIGATLTIDSARGIGTTVTVRLPHQVPVLNDQPILIVDDHPLFLGGLHTLLTAHGLRVVGQSRDGYEALTMARQLKPRVVLLDLDLPDRDSLEIIHMLTAELPGVRIVILADSANDAQLLPAIRSGAAGYLLKSQPPEELFERLSQLAVGEAALGPGVALRLMQELAQEERAPTPAPAEDQPILEERQEQILEFLADGLTYKEIGARLAISERTVRYHMDRILERLQLRNRAEAVSYALRRRRRS